MTDEEKENDPRFVLLRRLRNIAWTRMQALQVHEAQYIYWSGMYDAYNTAEQLIDGDAQVLREEAERNASK